MAKRKGCLIGDGIGSGSGTTSITMSTNASWVADVLYLISLAGGGGNPAAAVTNGPNVFDTHTNSFNGPVNLNAGVTVGGGANFFLNIANWMAGSNTNAWINTNGNANFQSITATTFNDAYGAFGASTNLALKTSLGSLALLNTVTSNYLTGHWNYGQLDGVPAFLTTVTSNNVSGHFNWSQIDAAPAFLTSATSNNIVSVNPSQIYPSVPWSDVTTNGVVDPISAGMVLTIKGDGTLTTSNAPSSSSYSPPIVTNGAAIPSDGRFDLISPNPVAFTAVPASSNSVYVYKVCVPFPMVVSNVVFRIGTANGGRLALSLYDMTGNKLLDSPTNNMTVTGDNIASLKTSTNINPGFYWMAWSTSLTNLATTIRMITVPSPPATTLNQSAPTFGIAANAASGGTNPATLGTVSAFTPVDFPLFVFKN